MPVMRYLFAIVLPPVGVLLCAKPVSALLNVALTLLFYFPGAIHAVLCVHSYEQERRHRELLAVTRSR